MKRFLNPVIFVLALVLVFEEWLWDGLKAQLHRLSRLPAVAAFERQLGRLNPWASLLVLAAPALVLFPFKLAGLWAFSHGHALIGTAIFVLAKVAGTASAAYLFDLVRPSALRLQWFAAVYGGVMRTLTAAKNWLRAQPLYQRARQTARALREALRMHGREKSWLRRKLRAARELARRGRRNADTP